MRYLLLPFFALRLIWSIGWFVLKLWVNTLPFSPTMIGGLAFLVWVFSSYALTYRANTLAVLREQILQQQTLKQRALSERAFWQTQLTHSPTHREILLRVATLSCQLKDWDTCEMYWQKAFEVDPNHEETFRTKEELTRMRQ